MTICALRAATAALTMAMTMAAIGAGCGAAVPSATCPPATTTATATGAATDDDVPPPDDALARWQAIHQAGDAPPPGTTAAALVPELLDYLGSPDPARRDGIAYEVLAAWIVSAPRLDDGEVRALIPILVGNLAGPLDAPDGVYRRSFSALALSLIVARDLKSPLLSDADRRDLLAAARAYAGRETDLRGHTGRRGWAHAAAHTADLLKFLAREPSFTDSDRAQVLNAVADLLVRPHGHIFVHGEDSRLAVPVLEALSRGVSAADRDAWLARLAAPLASDGPFEPVRYAAERNTRNFIFTLFVYLSTEDELPPALRDALIAVRALITG